MSKQETKQQTSEIVKQIDSSVLAVIGSQQLAGFEKAHVVADAIGKLKDLLTDEYMKPIMALQGNRLGFKTDKDKSGGYSIDVVRNCLIEAVLMGLQPTGNQFNILSGSTYPTKEGCGYLLNKFPGLKYDLVCSLPRINADKTGAAVDVSLEWSLFAGEVNKKTVPIPIKMDQYTSVDAIIGKATRKGRAWLLSKLTGTEVTDGDVQDVDHKVVNKPATPNPEKDRIEQLIKQATTLKELDDLSQFVDDDQLPLWSQRQEELKAKK